MSEMVRIATSKLAALSNAIRSKSGGTEEITLNVIPTIILSLAVPPLPTWADGTWEEIAQLLADHKAGDINLYETPGWEIGATRTVPLSAMAATGVGESHVAQDVEIVLADKNVYDLEDGSGKCVFTWDLKDVLANGEIKEGGYMNPRFNYFSHTNNGGWDGSARRTWCNNVFYNALPASFKALVPQVKVKASAGDMSEEITASSDYCFLRAEIEVFGARAYSVGGEGSQIEYYKTSEKNKKAGASDVSAWWLRSPVYSNNSSFCRVDDRGDANYYQSGLNEGIAPCGCI